MCTMTEEDKLKVELFDILEQSELLRVEMIKLDRKKNEKLQKLNEIRKEAEDEQEDPAPE